MNTFYGKKLTDLEPFELQLLGIDLNLTALVNSKKEKNEITMLFAKVFNLRTKLSNDCMKYGGNYSRQGFLNDTGFVDKNISMDEIKEVAKMMGEFEKGLKGVIKQIIGTQQKGDSHDTDGRNEKGFSMN